MAVRPPHSAEEWEVWTDAWIQTNRRHLIPEDIGIREWPEGITQGPGWFTLAEDHPFAGTEFCWRCIAEAQGFPAFEVIPHRRTGRVICWGPAEGNEAAEDPEPDAGPAEPPTGWSDRIIEASRFRSEVTDTGQGFWPPAEVSRPVHEPPWRITEDGRHRYAEPTEHPEGGRFRYASEALRRMAVRRMALGLGFETEDFRDEWPPSWTDDASTAEPVQADLTEREAQHDAQPVQADPSEPENRQPAADETP